MVNGEKVESGLVRDGVWKPRTNSALRPAGALIDQPEWARSKANMAQQAVILVGGLGTRLAGLGLTAPKPLLDVGGRPFLTYILDYLAQHAFNRVLLLAGHQSEQVISFAGAYRSQGHMKMDIQVSTEPEPLGTAGALKLAESELDKSFVLMNGDSIFLMDLAAFQRTPLEGSIAGHIALRQVDDISRYGSVDLVEDRIAAFNEKSRDAKPGLINAGVYMLSRTVIAGIPDGRCSLETEILPRLAAQGRLSGEAMTGFFLDIGIPQSFDAAQTLVPKAVEDHMSDMSI